MWDLGVSAVLDFSAKQMLDLVEDLFEASETVNKYDVVQKAKFYPLGADGERAVNGLPAKRYTKEQLTEALAHAVIEGAQ
jgi:hypothetical protein